MDWFWFLSVVVALYCGYLANSPSPDHPSLVPTGSVSHYHQLSEIRNEFLKVMGDRISMNDTVRDEYSKDASHFAPVQPEGVAFPQSSEEVQEIVKLCAKHKIPVVPYGVGSSLEGHVLPIHKGLTISFRLMKQVIEINPVDHEVTVQPGINRKALNDWLKPHGFWFPIDPGADSTIGGMASTRASGTTAVGYGTMKENVITMKVVLADGTLIRTASKAPKSSSGYDLTKLIVGSEGTLGVITEITLRIYPLPVIISAAIAQFPDVASAGSLVAQLRRTGTKVQRIELLNKAAMNAVNRKFQLGLAETPSLFIELHGPDAAEVQSRMSIIESSVSENKGFYFKSTTDENERDNLWRARHRAYWASIALREGAKLWVTDVCTPLSHLSAVISETEDDFASSFLIGPIVGHVGDGNFHLMVPIMVDDPNELREMERINDRLIRRAIAYNGTCSGEHGVGIGKIAYVELEHGYGVEVMRKIKRALDPHNIFNPGKLFVL